MTLTSAFSSSSLNHPELTRTIFVKDPNGHDVPVLDIIDCEGRAFSSEALEALKVNVTSVLRNQAPIRTAGVNARYCGWDVSDYGQLYAYVAHSDAHDDRSRVQLILSEQCPALYAKEVSEILTGGKRDAMGKALAMITLNGAAEVRYKPNPASGLHH